MKNNKRIVKLLTSAALALPGIQSHAEAPPPVTRAEFGYGTYDESGPRYDINVYQSSIHMPVTKKTSLSITTQRDLQTGASFVFADPTSLTYYFQFPNPGSMAELEPVYTRASIVEVRDSVTAKGFYYFPESIVGVGYRYSTEDDYLSNAVDVEWRKLFNKKNTELLLGAGYSFDRIFPTLEPDPTHLPRETVNSFGHKSTIKTVLGLRQDISQKTTGRLGASYSIDRGYLADPYKRVSIYGDARQQRPGSSFLQPLGLGIPLPFFLNPETGLTIDYDRRPGRRETWSVMGELVRYVERFNGSAHAQYRYTHDDWDVGAHMFEASYYQPFSKTWCVAPLARYYTQSEAKFYAYAFQMAGGYPDPQFLPAGLKLLPLEMESSSDNRLSKFGTFTAQLTLTKQFPADIDLNLIGGLYLSREWLHWGSDPEISHPYNNYTSTYFSVSVGINFD